MEHILQFGISIDDEAIKKNIEKSATDKLANEIINDARDALFERWGGGFTETGKSVVREFLKDHEDEILQGAIKEVTNTLKRSKKYREALAKIVEDENDWK